MSEEVASPARRKASIALEKARGAGSPMACPLALLEAPLEQLSPKARGASVVRRKAIEFARAVMPVIEQLRAEGHVSLNALARGLNARGLSTASGKAWSAASVRAVIRCAAQAVKAAQAMTAAMGGTAAAGGTAAVGRTGRAPAG